MAIIADLLRKFGLAAPGEPQEPEDIGVNEVGAEEKVVDDWNVIADKIYPEGYTYNGPAFNTELKFKRINIGEVKPDWLLEKVITEQCAKADATPLKATLRQRRVKLPFMGDSLISEYDLILHYHDSPLIFAISASIIGILIASGFVILATKAPEGEFWSALASDIKDTASGLSKSIMWGVLGVSGIFLARKFT